MYDEEERRVAFSTRASAALDKAEVFYLRILRAAILVIATFMLAYAAWLGASSLYKVSRSPDSVIEAQASVAADEITDAEMPSTADETGTTLSARENPAHKNFYRAFTERYYDLYRQKFEPFRQREDKQLSLEEFDDSFLNTEARLEAVTSGAVNFEHDKADLESLFAVLTEAADKPATRQRLEKYRAAKKVPVTRKVQRTRTTYRRGWDSSSMSCSNWYMEPVGCSVNRPVQTNYTENVTTQEFPKGTQSHTQIFKAFQNRYFELLEERRQANASKAEDERQMIIAGIADGQLSLGTALQILGAFLLLMFFFLLIAIERHQRRLSARFPD